MHIRKHHKLLLLFNSAESSAKFITGFGLRFKLIENNMIKLNNGR